MQPFFSFFKLKSTILTLFFIKRKNLQKRLVSRSKKDYNKAIIFFGGSYSMDFLSFFAEAAAADGAQATGGGGGWIILIGIAALVIMFIFSNRSQKKQAKEEADMRNGLAVGDEITTIGGIIGRIVSIKEETCVIETSHERTKIRILKSAVSRVDVKAEDSEG